MIKALIKIRAKQIYRVLLGIGLFRFVFLIGLLCFLLIMLFLGSQKYENASYITVGFLFVITLIQIRRKDKVFLQTHFSKYQYVFQVEYLLLTFSLMLCFLYHCRWLHLGILIVGDLLIPYINYTPKQRSFNTKLQQIIPNEMYEWKAGSRKLMFIILPLWIIGLFTSFFIGSVPIVIFITGILLINLYEFCEPYQMIIAFEKSSSEFLHRKIQLHALAFTAIVTPLMVAFVIFHAEYWYIVIIEYLLFISLHFYFILIKYAYYEPNEKPVSTQIMNTLGALAVLLPFLLPVVWVLSVLFYFNAVKQLNCYLNDFH